MKKKFKNKFAVKFTDPILGEAMKKKLIEIGHEWDGYLLRKDHIYILVNTYGGDNKCGFNQTPKHFDQEYKVYTLPQDWDKVIELASEEEKKWQVQEFRSSELKITSTGGSLFKGKFFDYTLSGLLGSNQFKHGSLIIHSVTDGEQVISVGDDTNIGRVIDFQFDGDDLMVKIDEKHGRWNVEYFDLKKVEKKPLFVTEDGVGVFKGDIVYNLCTKGSWQCGSGNPEYSDHLNRDIWKFFSTKEARDEYIFYNKPELALSDINQIVGENCKYGISSKCLVEQLEELVKSRLNKKS